MYTFPGVYIEHVPSGVLAIEAASTSVAAFIGPVKRGPVGEPVFITNGDQFAQQFGEVLDVAGGIRDEGDFVDRFGHAVQAFFANGGNKAYIVRVAETTGGGAPAAATAVLPNPEDATKGFLLTAKSPGAWANAMMVRLSTTDKSATPDLELGYTLELGAFQDGQFVVLESFTGLEMATTAVQSIEKVVAEQSTLAKIEGKTIGTNPGEIQVVSKALTSTAINLASPIALAGKKLEIKIGANPKVAVEFIADSNDLPAIALVIQKAMRAHTNGSPEFSATVVGGGNDQLRLSSGIAGVGGDVTAPTAASSTARTLLGFAAPTSADFPEVTLPTGSSTLEGFFDNGTNGTATPAKAAYDTVLTKLRDYRDISILLTPTLNWIEAGDNSIIQSVITHAEFMQNRMVVVDPPDTTVLSNQLNTPKDVKDLGVSTSPYVALYYPWLSVANPYYDPDTAANKPKTFAVPPSAFAAGMWARIDGSRGVWKAPAGLEATVRGTIGPNVLIGNDLQGNLNEFGINCLRSIIGPTVIWGARTRATKTKPEFRYVPVRRTQSMIGNDLQGNLNEFGVNCLRSIIGPTVIWGARTRATKTKPEYRYVPVRRTQSMIGESLYRALQAVVFEPNDHRLWASLRASVGNFMDTLHRAGAFQGEKASDAYFVKCNLGTTMTQADIDAGVVRVVVGFAPLKPAEFVVVQIKQIVGQTA